MPRKPQKATQEPQAKPALSEKERVHAAGTAITEVLERYNCAIVPGFAAPQPVGTNGSTLQLTAVWGIAALEN